MTKLTTYREWKRTEGKKAPAWYSWHAGFARCEWGLGLHGFIQKPYYGFGGWKRWTWSIALHIGPFYLSIARNN